VACLRALPHRLAVVDLSLSGLDHRNQEGLAVLDAVRRHDPGCVALLLTGYATVELAVSALTEYGALTCLRKETFRRAEFRDIVHKALADSGWQLAEGQVPRGEGDAEAAAPPPPAGEQSRIPSPTALPASRPEGSGEALVVEDDAGWRAILTEFLEELGYQVRACSSYGEARGYLRRQGFALAVVDLSLASSLAPHDNADGYRLLESTRKLGIPAIVVSGSALPAAIDRAYEDLGVVAYLEKQGFERQAFRAAVSQATAAPANAGELALLTPREREVLDLLARGLTNKEIAEALVISDNTVKRHLKAIFVKLDVSTRAAAAARAVGSR
jgi:DNA-binding NarL/FixJ family response regulator